MYTRSKSKRTIKGEIETETERERKWQREKENEKEKGKECGIYLCSHIIMAFGNFIIMAV
jgi:hypothetical protein